VHAIGSLSGILQVFYPALVRGISAVTGACDCDHTQKCAGAL